MRRTTITALVLLSLAFGARANDGVELSLRSKALASAATIRETPAPAASGETMMPLLPVMGETESLAARGNSSCTGREVCYDAAAGHIVLRPAREFMPRINGLTAENLKIRHNRVVFTYSFK